MAPGAGSVLCFYFIDAKPNLTICKTSQFVEKGEDERSRSEESYIPMQRTISLDLTGLPRMLAGSRSPAGQKDVNASFDYSAHSSAIQKNDEEVSVTLHNKS